MASATLAAGSSDLCTGSIDRSEGKVRRTDRLVDCSAERGECYAGSLGGCDRKIQRKALAGERMDGSTGC